MSYTGSDAGGSMYSHAMGYGGGSVMGGGGSIMGGGGSAMSPQGDGTVAGSESAFGGAGDNAGSAEANDLKSLVWLNRGGASGATDSRLPKVMS